MDAAMPNPPECHANRACACRPARHCAFATLSLLLGVLPGCDWLDGGDSAPPPPPPAPAPISRWTDAESGRVTGMTPDDQSAFDAAVARAIAGLADAQVRFATAESDDRSRWAVLWRALAADGTVEYLWVRPERWSPHRIEGRLASAPIAPAFDAMSPGDLVAFPVEEIADWLYERPDGTTDGGFTRAALEHAD